ncbi:3-hydroxyacyl-CoA dehydrogenase family protein [Bhargavaea beijingensis]|uniref:3-hydroxyacyl-CoA dehydrogenase family protein n=1 Tax=Bhargavaea beijingensis TaxID=426756 RepID=UPI0022255D5E|nr:3-hydroxyacyl-CoA dehydrogenase family protein [Bhargavaea beijingensis]MCW1927385.1 3-hydroxyacyl-CoA dehydrogenase family protein [Bhargavaea beijingensis]
MNQVAVIGAGAMGSQIAMVCALAGKRVVLVDLSEEALGRAKESLEFQIGKRVKKGKLTEQQAANAFTLLKFTDSIEKAVKHADLVIEAIIEKVEAKRKLFEKLNCFARKDAVLSTNSSTIVSSKLADVLEDPSRLCNLHFFNPALVMELVEVVKGPHTSTDTVERVFQFAKEIGKTPIKMEKEIFGFVTNRILNTIFDEAIFLYENGYASIEEIDTACRKGLNHPIGPFELMDLTGIDVNYLIREMHYKETGREEHQPQKSLRALYEQGHYGKKTGKGFYEYN